MVRLVVVTLVACSLLVGCPGDDGSDPTGGGSETQGNVTTDTGSSEATAEAGETGVGCVFGTEGCTCLDDATCNAGLFCNASLNICVADAGCIPGTEACACTPDGTCDPGLLCASNICVDAGCIPGTQACACTSEGTCDRGLMCLSGLCVPQG